MQAAGREAVLVLCSRDRQGGDRLWGALPPMPVLAPWGPEAWDVVGAVRQQYAIDVTVLRLLLRPLSPLIGAVTYAEFVRHIEPDEWIYHNHDVPDHLAIAAAGYRARAGHIGPHLGKPGYVSGCGAAGCD